MPHRVQSREFQPFDAGAAAGRGNVNALRQAQLVETGENIRTKRAERQRQQAIRSAGQKAGGNLSSFADNLDEMGFPLEALKVRKLRAEAQKGAFDNRVKAMEGFKEALGVIAKAAPAIESESQYQAFKATMEGSRLVPKGFLPEEFSEEAKRKLIAIGQDAKEKFRLLAGAEAEREGFQPGTVAQRNVTTGKVDILQEPDADDDKPRIRNDADGTPRFVDGPNAGKSVFGSDETIESFFQVKSGHANAIARRVGDLFGGTFDPISGRFTGLDRETAQRVLGVTERATEIFRKSRGAISVNEAAAQAAREAGVAVPAVSAGPAGTGTPDPDQLIKQRLQQRIEQNRGG